MANSSTSNFNPAQHPVLYFFYKLVLFVLIIVVLDFSLGQMLRYFYFRQTSGTLYRITYSLEKADQDILLFGSSRANHHYVPDVFEKKLNMSFYNAGEDGQELLFHLAVLRSINKRYLPKIIILDFNIPDFDISRISYERLSVLLPYYQTHPEIHDIIDMRGSFEKTKLFSQIYPFNSTILSIIAGNLKKVTLNENQNKGYMPLYKNLNTPLENRAFGDTNLDKVKISALTSFVSEATQAGSKVFIIISPYYMKISGQNRIIGLVKKTVAEFHAEFIDYSQQEFFSARPELFQDTWHLNDTGARIFSDMVTEDIKKLISAGGDAS